MSNLASSLNKVIIIIIIIIIIIKYIFVICLTCVRQNLKSFHALY